jgi:cytidyltransferase-like protein
MSDTASHVVVCGGFDDIRVEDVRFLDEAARLGPLHVLLWSDDLVREATGRDPKFPQEERLYFVQAIRYVERAHLVEAPADPYELPLVSGVHPRTWAIREAEQDSDKRAFCEEHRLEYRIFTDHELARFAEDCLPEPGLSSRKKVLVTGCYDWFHSGHVRFFEEVSELGDLYAVVGHDANIRLLKGEGHPMFSQDQRRYMVGSIRHLLNTVDNLLHLAHGRLVRGPDPMCLGPGNPGSAGMRGRTSPPV